MSDFFKFIAIVFVGLLAGMAVAFFAIWGLALVLFLAAIFIIAYFADIRFTVTKDGKKIGTYTRRGGFQPFN